MLGRISLSFSRLARSPGLVAIALLVSGWMAGSAWAAADAEKRVALVIGNSAYRNVPTLVNPVNDAQDVAAALRLDGFDVIEGRDLDRRGTDMLLGRFSRAAAGADVALFYYAGHGLQFRGENFLVPVDGAPSDEFAIPYETTRVGDVVDALSHAKGVRILILDACRNNPLSERLSRSASRDIGFTRGLARIRQSQGMVIAYATQANDVASDGGGRNSPFSSALVTHLKEPGLEIGQLFRRVAATVNQETNGQQTPELSISLLGDFYFNRSETDLQAWAALRDTDDSAKLRQFLSRYPASVLGDAARARLDMVERGRREETLRGEIARLETERLRAAKTSEEQQRAEQAKLAREQGERQRLVDAQAEERRTAEAAAAKQQADAGRKLAERLAQLEEENRRANAELALRVAEQDRRSRDERERDAQAKERDRLASERAGGIRDAELDAARQRAEEQRRSAARLARLEEDSKRATAELASRLKAEEEQRKRAEADRAQMLAQIEAERRGAADELQRLQREKTDVAARDQVASQRAAATVAAGGTQVASLASSAPLPAVAPIPAPTPSLVQPIKAELSRLGCYQGAIDENWSNPATARAVQSAVRLARLEAPGGPSDDFLKALKAQPARICPLVCSPRQVERNGACVAKACPAGGRLDADGDCLAPRPRPAPERRVTQRAAPAAPAAAAAPAAGRGKCFAFNGRSFCE